MNRYLFRVTYSHTDGHESSEKHVIRAETEAEATTEVDDATKRYPAAVGATKNITRLSTVAEA